MYQAVQKYKLQVVIQFRSRSKLLAFKFIVLVNLVSCKIGCLWIIASVCRGEKCLSFFGLYFDVIWIISKQNLYVFEALNFLNILDRTLKVKSFEFVFYFSKTWIF